MKTIENGRAVTKEELERFLAEMGPDVSAEKIGRARRHILSLYDALPADKIITPETLAAWRRGLSEKGLSPRTAGTYVTDVNMLLKWIGLPALCFRGGRGADLTGRVFGDLTVLEPTGKTAEDRSRIWRCRCGCGGEITAPANKLLYGCYTSCGCRRGEAMLEQGMYIERTCLRQVLSDVTRSDNTSGCPGVYRKRDGWAARIQYRKNIYNLGFYHRKEDAIRARKQAEAWVKDDAESLLSMLMGTDRKAV